MLTGPRLLQVCGLWLVLLAVLAACAPFASPVGGFDLCAYVREAVRSGGYTVEVAEAWYPDCAPFPVPGSLRGGL